MWLPSFQVCTVLTAGGTTPTEEAQQAEDDTVPDASSVADLLHVLEGAAVEGQNWSGCLAARG